MFYSTYQWHLFLKLRHIGSEKEEHSITLASGKSSLPFLDNLEAFHFQCCQSCIFYGLIYKLKVKETFEQML